MRALDSFVSNQERGNSVLKMLNSNWKKRKRNKKQDIKILSDWELAHAIHKFIGHAIVFIWNENAWKAHDGNDAVCNSTLAWMV